MMAGLVHGPTILLFVGLVLGPPGFLTHVPVGFAARTTSCRVAVTGAEALGCDPDGTRPRSPADDQLPRCRLVNLTVSLEKEGCPTCHPMETTICSGRCFTKDPVLQPKTLEYQRACTYKELHYRTFVLPDCLPDVDPTVHYPVAVSCYCGHCSEDTTDCTLQSQAPDKCMATRHTN